MSKNSRRAAAVARSGARASARAGVSAGAAGARTARDHPRAAAEGVGVVALGAVVLTGVVLLKLARSRRVRRAASTSAQRGAFGPAVAVATRAATHRGHADDASA